MNPRILRILLISIMATSLATLAACGKEETKKPDALRMVKTTLVSKPQTKSIREFPGKVLATEQAHLAFEVPGQLIKLPIDEGDTVEKGALLAEINPKNYQEAVNRADAKMLRTEAEFKRYANLVKKGFVTRSDYDQKNALYRIAQADYNTAVKDLNDTKILAPFKGIIARKFVKNFENVKAKQDVLLLQDIAYLDIEINVPEYIVRNLKTDEGKKGKTKAVAIFEGQNKKEYPLNFKEFSSQADPETQTYRIVFRMPAPKAVNIFPGMTVTVKVPIPDIKSGGQAYITIPSSAVFDGPDGKPNAWVVNPQTLKISARDINTSRLQGNKIRVISGLKPGERIVTAGVHFLENGQKIKLMDNTEK